MPLMYCSNWSSTSRPCHFFSCCSTAKRSRHAFAVKIRKKGCRAAACAAVLLYSVALALTAILPLVEMREKSMGVLQQ